MSHRPYRLSARFVATVKEPGRYGDGRGSGGLSLLVKRTQRGDVAKSWAQRIIVDGRARNIGLGSYPHVSLAEARERCQVNRAARRSGELVLSGRKRKVPTFAEATERVIEIHRAGWRGGDSERQWRSSLRDYAFPKLGSLPVHQINTADVMAVLLPIWNEKRVTAGRVRNRISAVMKWAVAQGLREHDPAGDVITAALPKNGRRTQHQRALPFAEVGGAVAKIRTEGTNPVAALAFEFLVLTAARTGEVRGARWSEMDLQARTWTVPAERMKKNLEHRVPLSRRAVDVLQIAMESDDGSGWVFPGGRIGAPMGQNTLSNLVKALGIQAVPHGFRSSFAVWAAERTDAPREVRELALAHVNDNRTAAAYQRSDLFEKRRELMEAWAREIAS